MLIEETNKKLEEKIEVKVKNWDKEHIKMIKNIKDINFYIYHQGKPHIKQINVLKMNSNNFKKCIDIF